VQLLQQFDKRGNELTWNSDGIIFIDQVSIPNSDIYILFPYLFKRKHPKNLAGFQDFVKKICDMGLGHLIVSGIDRMTKNKSLQSLSTDQSGQGLSENWWYIG
jgi:hypothetical protein